MKLITGDGVINILTKVAFAGLIPLTALHQASQLKQLRP